MERRPTTPHAVSGRPDPASYATLKASRELDELLQSEKKGAGVKAFSRGFGAASASTFILGGMPELFAAGARRADLADLQDASRLSQYLQETRGMTPAVADANAAGVMKLLQLRHGVEFAGLGDQVVTELRGVHTAQGPMNVDSLLASGWPNKREAVESIQDAVARGAASPAAALRTAGPSMETREAVLDYLRKSYQPKVPRSAALRILLQRLKPVALGALPFGVMGGVASYKQHQENKRELRRLSGRAG